MALESANNASELSETNPTSTDLVKSADDHIRMLKRILKQGFQGHFTSIATVRALTSVDGSWFTYNGDAYAVYTSTLEESLPTVIKLDNDKVAIRYNNANQPQSVLLPTAATQRRYPRVEQIEATSFDTSAVNAAFGGTPVKGDIAIVVGTNFGAAKIFTTIWEDLLTTEFGHHAFVGTASALCLAAPMGLIDNLRAERIELISPTHAEVISPAGFGPDNLRYWFGLNSGVLDGNGNIAYNSLSKTNAIEWKNMTTGTTNGNSTPVDGGVVVTGLGMATAYTCRSETYNLQPADEDARIAFGVDGTFSILALGDVTVGTPVSGNYITTPSNSTGFLYEVKFEKMSGDAVVGTLNTWQQISAPRQISLLASRSTSGTDSKSAVIKMTVRKVGNAGTEVFTTVTLSATAVCNAGSEP
ncbi:MAG: hypothetical protein [Siphoviridae sp. ct7UA22]|nr:MAG: hypothetical protein [Siphoviridae sp. ct7UA22]